jgi:hypothetical protein
VQATLEQFDFKHSGGMSMTKIASWLMVITAVMPAVLGGKAISAQDKYTVQVPNGLAFSEFRGYEDWQTVAVSQTEDMIEVAAANCRWQHQACGSRS